jgi:hypothetical protein
VAETIVKRPLCCGFRPIGKTKGQVINVGGGYIEKRMFFPGIEYHMFYVLYPFVTYLLTIPRTSPTASWRSIP